MEETISLKEIFDLLRKHISTILISMFAGLAIAAVATFFIITPTYSARAQLIVTLPQSDGSASNSNLNDVNYNLQMLNTYKDIIKEGDALSTEVHNRLKANYDLDMTATAIKENLEVTQSENSQMFSISATSDKATDAKNIANTAAEVFQDTLKDVLNNVDKVTIISKATTSTTPVSPNNKLNLAIGLVLGLMVGVGLALIFELLDRTIKDQKYVTDALGFTLLGAVPEMTAKDLKPSKAIRKEMVQQQEKESDAPRRRSRV
ncbi:YveK family protein [Enterococcus italicus]